MSPPSKCTAQGRVESELVGHSEHRRPRHGSGSSSMQPIGCTPWCPTDALVFISTMHQSSNDVSDICF